MATLVPDPARVPPAPDGDDAAPARSGAFGYGAEDLRLVLEPMGSTGADPVWSMGDDTPIPPLSAVPQSLYAYFRQRFAQVTNPPIDSLRESMVMSLRMHLGRRGSPLLERPSLRPDAPAGAPDPAADEMAALRNVAGFSTVTLDAVWDASKGVDGLRPALTALRRAAERAARRGARILIISDRAADDRHAPIPMLLAIGAVRQHLVHTGLRARVGLVAEAGDAFDIHHFATLIGYGAEAVHPVARAGDGRRRCSARQEQRPAARREPDGAAAVAGRGGARGIRSAAEKGCSRSCRRWASRRSRRTAARQIFEVLGLGHEVDRDLLRGHRVAASAASASRRSRKTCWRAIARRIARRTRRRPRCPITGGCASGRKARTTAGRRRSSWRCSRRSKARTAAEAYGGFLAEERRAPAGGSARPARRPPGDAGSARRGRAGRGDPPALHLLRHVARRAVAGGARDALHRDEPDGRPLQLGRGRRGSRATTTASATATGPTTGSSRWRRRASA